MQTPPNTSPTPKPRRRWFQFGLRGLLVVVTICAMLAACWKAHVGRYRLQRLVAEGIREVGGRYETEPAGPQWLARLLGEDELVSVVSVDCSRELTDAQLEQLRCLTELKSIKLQFSVPYDERPGLIDDRMPFIGQLTSLEEFDLSLWSSEGFSDEGLSHVAGLTNLRKLDLSSNDWITDDGLKHLANLTKLEAINLNGARIDGTGLVHLAQLPKLRTLRLAGTQTTDEQLVHLQSLRSLSHLDLTYTPVGDRGAEHLGRMRHLTHLDLTGTRITDAGLEQLSALSRLESLYVGATQISDAGVKHLNTLTNLDQLSLGRTQVTDAGLRKSALPKLEFLDLLGTGVTDAGLEHLKTLPMLRRVGISTNEHLTDAGVARLQETLPRLQIHLSPPGQTP